MTRVDIPPRVLIDRALAELNLVGGSFSGGESGIAFTVNGKRLHLSYTLLKLCRSTESVKRAIVHQMGSESPHALG